MDLDLKKMAFIVVRPPAKVLSTRTLKNKAELQQLLTEATNGGHLVYAAEITKTNGRLIAGNVWRLISEIPKLPIFQPEPRPTEPRSTEVQPSRPHDTAEPNRPVTAKERVELATQGILTCKYCGQTFTSTSGRTLHIKAKHRDKL